MKKWVTIEKSVGETPLQALEQFRTHSGLSSDIPLAYAGRLDPMASGTLLILIGEECKKQKAYHGLDKEYRFEVLLGVRSDSGDVLGVVEACSTKKVTRKAVRAVMKGLIGDIELPYPRFSSKTIAGKPLHTWTLENRLDEITIPLNKTHIHTLTHENTSNISKENLHELVLSKIDTLPQVTETSKELGRDFRRTDVKHSWNQLFQQTTDTPFTILAFRCIASSGTYMRTLAETIAENLGSCGLALSINRTKIGRYRPITKRFGFWSKKY